MQPVLIYKDETRIRDEKAYLDKVIVYLQDLYNEFKSISIEVSLIELTSLGRKSNNISLQSKEKQIQNFVTEYLITLAGEPNFNGVKISRDKLREMVEKPDLSNVFSIIENSWHWMIDGYAIVDAWLKLENDVISKSDEAYNLITSLYSHYSKNDYGAFLTTKLIGLCATINEYHGFAVENGIFPQPTVGQGGMNVKGIEYSNYIYRPDLSFIRQQEANKPNYVAN